MSRARSRTSRPRRHRRAAVLALTAGLAVASAAAFAQTYIPREPGSTANTSDRPAPDTPIPSYYRESYRVYLKMKAAAHGGTRYTRASYATMPDWSGLWQRDPREGVKFDPKQTGNPFQPLGPVTADLTPRYRAAFEERLHQVAGGNEWDQLSDCLPAGYPRWLVEPFLREIVVTPSETWWLTEQESEVRRIYTDGRGHVPDEAARSLWEGDSIGFWDGQTLVVHTIRLMHGEYQRVQPDHSDQVSTVERIRMIDPNTMEDDVTLWDPKGLLEPWHVVDHYKRVTAPGERIDMWSCESNNNVVRTPSGGSQFILPGETLTIKRSYREPDTFYLTEAQKKLFAGDEAQGNSK
ncbi:MAG: hypothetical protein ACREUG_04680 [Steroidobacteraceae bacterium]